MLDLQSAISAPHAPQGRRWEALAPVLPPARSESEGHHWTYSSRIYGRLRRYLREDLRGKRPVRRPAHARVTITFMFYQGSLFRVDSLPALGAPLLTFLVDEGFLSGTAAPEADVTYLCQFGPLRDSTHIVIEEVP